ncbi:hypothetical protein HK103_007409 [Boothiomyces macroporosus]|uniref:Uncharacterized protein n=1 Tax=Boothiomyces macroporosus TaxID=261099 RepID=A0AAD5UKT5_9FUNG|nr:hypothetical protein HK103_007409 [Boothiomyces macroporosus]
MENRVDNHSYEMHSREQRPSDSNNSPRAPPQSSMPPKLSPSFNPNRISASSGGSSDKDAKELLESIPQSPNSNVHSGYEYQHDYQGRENASYPQNNDNYYQYGQPYPAQYDGQYPPEAKGYEHGQGYDYGYDQYNQQYNQQYPEYGYQQGYNYGQPEYEQSHPSYAPNSAYTASYANQPYPQEDYAHTISNYESSYQHSIHSHDPSEYGRNVKFDKDAKSEKNYSSPLKTNRMSAMSTGSVIHERYCCGMFKSKRKCALVCVPIWTILLAIIGSQLVILGVAVFFLFPRNPTFTIGQVQEVDPLAVNDVATLRTGNPPFQANFSMETDIVVTSSNYIAWSINQLTIKAFIRIPFIDPKTNKLGYTIAPVEVASGSRSAITLRAQGNTTIPIVIIH